MNEFIENFGHLSDQDWLEQLVASTQSRVQRGVTFPGFPSEQLQKQFVGSANEHALREAYQFYITVKGYAQALGVPLDPHSKILDFGVGWGRIIRFFLKDVPPSQLFGVDVDPDILASCQAMGVPGNLSKVEPVSRLPYADNSFQIVYAYSVFSHLSEQTQLFWVEELARVLRPGGVLIVTTEARDFIQYCASLLGQPLESDWHRALATAFPDPAEVLAKYDAGQFIYAPTGGGDHRDASFYGEAVIPKAYVERVWTQHLGFRAFIDDRSQFWQSVIIMQK